MLHNPAYAGAYAYGRGISEDRPRHSRPASVRRSGRWLVLLPDRLPAYIGWDAYERNVAQMAANRRRHHGVPRGGPSLLSGLLVCGRCGHRMLTMYRNNGHDLVYVCAAEVSSYGGEPCQSFSGRALDAHVAQLILEALPLGARGESAARRRHRA